MPIPRPEAETLVSPFIHLTDSGMQYVTHGCAQQILSTNDFARLMRNPVRNLGPMPGTVYPWSVVDYLAGYQTEREKFEANNVSKAKD